MIKLSIIIPVLNEVNTIPELLETLRNHAFNPSDLELIFVDGGSQDGTLDLLKNIEDILLTSLEELNITFLSAEASKKDRDSPAG